MAHISGHVRMAAPLEHVFDTVADSRNEPSFNPAMTNVELLTPAPVGLGTRFLAHMGKADLEMIIEVTEFERPHRLAAGRAARWPHGAQDLDGAEAQARERGRRPPTGPR